MVSNSEIKMFVAQNCFTKSYYMLTMDNYDQFLPENFILDDFDNESTGETMVNTGPYVLPSRKPNPNENKLKAKRSKRYSKVDKRKAVVTKPKPTVTMSAAVSQAVPEPLNYEGLYEELFMGYMCRQQPHFLGCNSLLAFPKAMTSCLNSGNFVGLADLVSANLERDCSFSLSYNRTKLSCRSFVRFFEIMNDVHPDRIMTVHACEQVADEVVATVFVTYTDSKLLYEAVANTVSDPTFFSFFPDSRAACLRNKMVLDRRPPEERQQISQLIEADFDLVVYGTVQLRLKLNGCSGKGTDLALLCHFNSVYPAAVHEE